MVLSPYDQQVYNAGFKFVPQTQYLLNPFQIPQGGGADASKPDFGIPSLKVEGGGGGGGAAFTGGISDLTSGFQTAVDDRQKRLLDAYNNPSTAKVLGMNMFKQDVNPVDAGAYLAADMRIPQQRTMLGKMFQPQSAQEIMEEGYKPMTNIGILTSILGKADKFGTLPRADQAFITSQMGYTGPTVFGDNQSGLSKDPFGLNTRSAFGNYAERVGVEADKLGGLLSGKMTEKYGKGTSGITFNAATGMFEAIDDEDQKAIDAALKATQMNKLNITKLNFYRDKVKERDELRAQEEADRQAAIDAAAAESRKRSQILYDREQHGDTNYGLGSDNQQSYSGDALGDKDLGFGIGATTGGPVSNKTGKGRTDYMDGGLTDLVDIYD
jgi:hypothetical protein